MTRIPKGFKIDRSKYPIEQIMPPEDYLVEYTNEAGCPDWKVNPKYLIREDRK